MNGLEIECNFKILFWEDGEMVMKLIIVIIVKYDIIIIIDKELFKFIY